MWNRLLMLLLLLQRNIITTQPVINENRREARQLNFADCCPCPEAKQEVRPDQDAANSRIFEMTADDNCPCRLASDSEPASSVFRSAIQPLDRPLMSKKEEPKPLLKPEVGLASSVLETLQEVTNQEYIEAMARDAARNSYKFMESETPESETRNLVNIILTPNHEPSDEIISEASHVQEIRYNHPHLNNIETLKRQPPLKMLEQIFPSSKLRNTINSILLRKNRLDTIDGASNQVNTLQLLKNDDLDPMKLKTKFLKFKLLPNTENKLENIIPNNFKVVNQVDSNTDDLLKLHNEQFTDHENLPAQNNIWKNSDIGNKAINRDSLLSPSNFKKYIIKNNVKDHMLSQNRNPLFNAGDSSTSQTSNRPTKVISKNVEGYKDIEHIKLNDDNDSQSKLLSDTIGKKLKLSDALLQNSECYENVREPITYRETIKDLDIVPSPSKKNEVKTLDEDINNVDYVRQTEILGSNNVNSSTFHSTTENFPTSHSGETIGRINKKNMFLDVQNDDSENKNSIKYTNCIDDLQSESSNNNNQTNYDEKLKTSQYSYELENIAPNSKLLSLTSKESDEMNFKIPNIKADILRTLENFKNANEKIQEKLRSNVQNALQTIIERTESQTEHSVSFIEQPNNSIERTTENIIITANNDNEVSAQDLQKMSDSLLKLGSLKETDQKIDDKILNEVNILPSSILSNVTNDINIKRKSNSNNQDFHMIDIKENDKSQEELCSSKIIPNVNEDNEMIAQSSNSVLNTLSRLRLSPDTLKLLPEDTNKDTLEKLTALGAVQSLYKGNNNNDKLSLFNNKNNIDSYRNFDKVDSIPLNPISTLKSYNTKMIIPQARNLNALLPYTDKTYDASGPANIVLQKLLNSNMRDGSNDNFNIFERNNGDNENSPFFKTQLPKRFQDTLSTIVPNLSDNLKSQSNNVLKSFRDTLEANLHEPLTVSNNKIFGKSLLNSENLRKAVLETNDKLEEFNSDISKRLNSLNPKIFPETARLRIFPNRLNSFKNNPEINNKLFKVIKNKPLSKTIKSLESSKDKLKSLTITPTKLTSPAYNDKTVYKSINEKLKNSPHQLNTDKGSIVRNLPEKLLKNKSKVKPLKENKVYFSFTTHSPISKHPDTIKLRSRPSINMDHFNPRSTGAVKPNRKSILKSKSKSNEPEILASNVLSSKTPYPKTTLESSKLITQPNLAEDTKINENIFKNKNTLNLSKLKNAIATKFSNRNMNKNQEDKISSTGANKNVDATQSASNNIDRSVTIAEPLKENTSYKCKMVCIKDILDATDTY